MVVIHLSVVRHDLSDSSVCGSSKVWTCDVSRVLFDSQHSEKEYEGTSECVYVVVLRCCKE